MGRSCQVFLAAAVLVLAGCSHGAQPAPASPDPDVVTIGSFGFTESRLLAEVYAAGLRAAGIPVEVLHHGHSREILEPALEQGLVDIVPEYAGSALEFLTHGRGQATSDLALTRARLIRQFDHRGIRVLASAPATSRNVIVVRGATARQFDLARISDLAAVDDRFVFGGPPECPERPLCLLGLEQRYGLSFAGFQPLDAGGPLTVAALEGGEIDVGLLFSSDPSIPRRSFVVLADDRRLQPAENVTPVIRHDVVARHGGALVERIDAISQRLTTTRLQHLIAATNSTGDATAVAEYWIAQQGLGPEPASGPTTPTSAPGTVSPPD